PSAATKAFFPIDEIAQPETKEDAEFVLRSLVRSKELRDRTVHKAQRRIWAEHTYTHRAMSVMDALAIDHTKTVRNWLPAVVSTTASQSLPNSLEGLPTPESRTCRSLRSNHLSH